MSANQTPPSSSGSGPRLMKLKRGETLFAEGDNSTAMFLLKSGTIRVFKKKGNNFIEIDTVRSGQIIGELAFLDGLPRSASCEAIQDCELIEISGATFTDTMSRIPEWLKALLKTIVTRLRASSNKIRQLETANQGIDYSKDAKATVYTYLPQSDAMKIGAAILLIAAHGGQKGPKGALIPSDLVRRYGVNVFGIPDAKMTSFLDILVQLGFASSAPSADGPVYEIFDLAVVNEMVNFLQTEMSTSSSNRRDLSLRGFLVMSFILKHMGEFRKDPNAKEIDVDIAWIQRKETELQGGKTPFKVDEVEELIRMGFSGPLQYPSDDSRVTRISFDPFMRDYRTQRILKSLDALNEQKRKTGK